MWDEVKRDILEQLESRYLAENPKADYGKDY
jgi:hypothetical protein